MTVIFLTSPTGSNQTWNVPVDWNSSNNSIEVIAGGGGGRNGGSSGGGGGYAKKNNLSLTPGGTATYQIGSPGVGGTAGVTGIDGTAGTDSWFNGTTGAGASVWAGGGGGTVGATPGAGGVGHTGDTLYTGGAGAAGSGASGPGGGGAAGPGGPGGTGGATTGNGGAGGGANGGGANGATSATNTGANGGASISFLNQIGAPGGAGSSSSSVAGAPGSAGSGGGGGFGDSTSLASAGGAGGAGTEWDASHGSGGGGGSSGAAGIATGSDGGAGGLYGGGGAGSGSAATTRGAGGNGAQGAIRIAYTPVHVSGVNYYVDSSAGSDSNNGTSPTFTSGTNGPWATLAFALTKTYNGSDTLSLQGGQTFTTALALGTANAGTGAPWSNVNPFTVGSYGTGSATISISSTSSHGISALNVQGLVLQNLIVTGPGIATSTTDGVLITNSIASQLSFFQLINLTVSAFGGNGIWLNSTTSGFDSVTISGCISHDNTGGSALNETCGIKIQGLPGSFANTNVHITGCTVYNNTGNAANSSDWTGGGILAEQVAGTALTDANGNSCGCLIEYCIAHDNGSNAGFSISGPVGIFLAAVSGGVIQFCESYLNKNGSFTVDGDGYDVEASINCVVQYCYSHNNAGNGFLLFSSYAPNSGITFRYCISQNNGRSSSGNPEILVGADSNTTTGLAIYNNTVYASGNPALGIGGSGSNTVSGRICNNIFYTTGTNKLVAFTGTPSVAGLHLDGNNYYASGTFSADWTGPTNYTTFSTWKTNSGQETANGGFSTDPALTSPGGGGTTNGYNPGALSAYKLQSSSTMFGAGINLSTSFSITPGLHDYYGNSIPKGSNTGFPVGAYGAAGNQGVPKVGVGNMIGWRPALLGAAAWKFGKAVAENARITRRRLLRFY